MEGQKTENLLNLALDATQEEREKSLELEVGYHPGEREWDLIIKYSGDLEGVRGIAARTTKLLNEYAVVTVAESRIQELAALPEVEYVENLNGCISRWKKGSGCLVSMRYRTPAFLFWDRECWWG